MVKILKYDNPYHKIKLKIRRIQLLGKSTGQINNTGYEMFTKFFSAIGFILGLMDFSDIAILCSMPNSCCQQNLKCFDKPL